jgi:hypothetical protein
MNHATLGSVTLGLLFAAPWIVAIVWFWRKSTDDGYVAPSLGESARRRLGL